MTVKVRNKMINARLKTLANNSGLLLKLYKLTRHSATLLLRVLLHGNQVPSIIVLLTPYTQNCKDFSKEPLQIVAHI